ncbi:heme biosynthesis HemY N-terminal domain-containing protein [Catenovulum maritimum]|uniref:HemY N-terminal domain-containing protein n=1 Tax=Catenovulum maritimum TaxID=1513271 RepID=A0A0J8JNQ5_9ALTE|nr:heme biosynthesis HemY N-terminal domain-containing protein [Catenovulum maritimum]KMT66256.1 hypothetical protein XM47_04490 [Catenovulum maritimum]
MIRFILAFFALCCLLAFGSMLAEEKGYVLISVSGWTWEMNLFGFFFVLLIAYIGIKACQIMLRLIFNSKRNFSQWREKKAKQKSLLTLQQSLQALFNHDFALAEKLSLKNATKSPIESTHYLVAAEANKNLNQPEKVAQLLLKAESHGDEVQKKLAMVKSLVTEEKQDKAISLCEELHQAHPKDAHVLNLLAQVYQEANSADKLRALLPQLRKHSDLSLNQFNTLVYISFKPAFEQAGQNRDKTQIESLYKQIKKWVKTSPIADNYYLASLVAAAEHESAEKALIKILKADVSEQVIASLYNLPLQQPNKLISYLEKQIKAHPENDNLLTALGICAAKNYDWQLAQQAIEASIKVEKSAKKYALLGAIYEQQNMASQAKSAYQHGLAMALNPSGNSSNDAFLAEIATERT